MAVPQSSAPHSALRMTSSCRCRGNDETSAYAQSGGGDSGEKAGEEGRGKREGSATATAAAATTGSGSEAGAAGDTVARSETPVMSAQKQGASLGADGEPWGPAWPAAWWGWQASRARTVRPPGPAASQQAAASGRRATVAGRGIR